MLITIEEFFGTLQQSTVESWRKHLKTNKYSSHMALDDFYKEMPELVDTLIEDYMGIYGKVENYKNVLNGVELDTIDYLERLRGISLASQKKLLKDPELKSDVDDILSLIDSTMYKLKELTESEYGYKNIVDFLKESLS